MMEKIKKDTLERRKAGSKAFKAELEAINVAVEAAKETAHSKDKAYLRRCEALERSLKAAESASKMWRQGAELVESFLLKEKSLGEGYDNAIFAVNG